MYLETGSHFRLHGSDFTFWALVLRDGVWMVEASRPCEGEPDEAHLLPLADLLAQ